MRLRIDAHLAWLGVGLAGLLPWSSAGLAPPAPATTSAAQLADLDLEQLGQVEIPEVYAASRRTQKTTEAPSSVTVIPREEIKAYGWRTLGDLLRSVGGFYVTYDRSYSYIGVRGFNRPGDYGGRVLLMVDGHRLNDPIYDTAAVGHEFILDLDLVERVEIVRGPGSALYGNNAFLAVVNVVTRRTEGFGNGEAAGAGGNHEAYRARLSLARVASNGVEVLVSGSAAGNSGEQHLYFPEFHAPESNSGRADRMDDERSPGVYARIGRDDWSVALGFVDRRKQVPTAIYGAAFADDRYQQRDARFFTEAVRRFELAGGGQVEGRVYFDQYAYQADYPFGGGTSGVVVINRDDQVAEWAGTAWQWSRQVAARHRVVAGFEYRSDFHVSLMNQDQAPRTVYQDEDDRSQHAGVFLEDEIRVATNLFLSLGARADWHDEFDSQVSPRLAVIYQPLRGTVLKLLGGSAYRGPNAYERKYVSNMNAANPELRPEEIRTAEAVVEQQAGDRLRLNASVFYNEIDYLISQASEEATGEQVYRNVDGARARGVECGFDARLAAGAMGRGSYTVVETEEEGGGRELDNAPGQLVKVNLAAPLGVEWLRGAVEAQYTAARTTYSGLRVEDFWVVNANLLALRIAGRWDLSLGIFNVLDATYADPTDDVPETVRQDGRTFLVKGVCSF